MKLFLKKLNYLGSTLGLSPEMDSYVDLEEFFLEASLYLNADSRVKQAILNWLYRYSSILSPSKIRRMLKLVEHDKVVVNQIVLLLLANRVVKTNWNILVTIKHLEAISFKSNEKKYLKSNKFILKTVPELRLRAEGRTQVVADIIAFTQKHSYKSLYEVAKQIYSPRNRVNESFRQLSSFGVLYPKES